MLKRNDRNIITGLDIGTSKVAVIVAERTDNNEIEIIGIGTAPSKGLKKGVVVNLETTVLSIQRAVEEAELMAGCQIKSVIAGISGGHVRSLNSHGIVAIKDKEVMQYDIDRVIDSACAVAIPADQKILHIVPQEFVIDQQEGIKEPIGMSGIRLEARVHIVTCNASAAQNITKCIERCGLEVEDTVLEQLASCASVLAEDEKELGVCLIDIGGGTTDIAIFSGGAVKHTAVIPIAGDQVTNDIAVALRTPTQCAEQNKQEHACVLTQMADAEKMIDVPSIGDRKSGKISVQNLAKIIGPRYEELMLLIQAELRRSGYEDLIAAGIVLTGGGAKVAGLTDLTEEIFHMPVRMGLPQYVTGLTDVVKNPVYATGVGLLLYGDSEWHGGVNRVSNEEQGVLAKIKHWFKSNF